MSITCIVIMVVGIVAALFGMNKQKKGAVWGQPLAVLGAILAIGAALWNVVNTSIGGGQDAAISREQRYIKIEHKFLGEAVMKQVPGVKKVAVLVDPLTHYDMWGEQLATPGENLQLAGLKEGMPGVEIVEVYPVIPKQKKPAPVKGPDGKMMDMPMMPPMMMDMMSAKSFNQCLAKAKDCDVFVSLYMLPPEMSLPMALVALKGKKVALSNVGNLESMKAIFADAGKSAAELVAVVTSKASAIYDDSIPSSDQAAFDKRYALITKDNYKTAIDEAMKQGKK